MIRSAGELGDRFALCRYEDLVTDGEPLLRELMDTIGEDFSADLLQHHVVQREQGSPRIVDGSTSTREPIDPQRAYRWVDDVSDTDRHSLERLRPLAEFYGYEPVEAKPPAPIDPPSGRRLTMTGDDVRRRREHRRGRLDFETPPPTSLALDADPEDLARRLAHAEAALTRT